MTFCLNSLLLEIHVCFYLIFIDVGKSNILQQFVNHKFRGDHLITIGVEFLNKTINVSDKIIQIQVWDTVIF